MPGAVGLWKHPVTARFYLTWTEPGGRSRRASTGTTDRGEAEKVRSAFVLERDRRPEARPDEISLVAVLESYWQRHARRLPSAERIGIAINHLTAFYGAATVQTVNARSHERYIELCRSEGKADGTINRHLGSLRAALRFAVKSGDLAVAPHVPSLQEPPPRPHVLDRAQVAALLRAARTLGHEHIALFIRLAVYTGARKSAILQLTWDRVDLHEGTADFRLPGVAHSRKRRAITGLPAKLVSTLRRQYARSTHDRVITWRGQPIASIKHSFRETARKADLVFVTPHVLKHTAVTWALRVATPWVVSGMTATSIRTLQSVYGKYMLDDVKAAAEAMARKSRANPSETRAGSVGINRRKMP